jgi:hypothetical protein
MLNVKAYIKDGVLYVRPASERDVPTIREWVKALKTSGLRAVDVDMQPMNPNGGNDYDDDRYGYDRNRDYSYQRGQRQYPQQQPQQYYNPYGYGPQSYMPMPPDFNPEAHHYPSWPWILPFILRRDDGGGYRDRDYGSRRRMDVDENPDRDDDAPPPREPPRRDIPRA